jgi:LmbE family N-acetylglucosaminyl deacetylase
VETTGGGLRVLYLLAHPDDEDPYTVTYLARARGCTVTLLSLTRGEGGMNALGDQAEEALGFLRTHELLAAAREYGAAAVLFGSAFDYGYSRRLAEARERWDQQVLLDELAHAIELSRADLVISRFAEDDQPQHAQHRLAGRLARIAVAEARKRRGPSGRRLGLLVGREQSTGAVLDDEIRRAAERGYHCHRSQVPVNILVLLNQPVVYEDVAGRRRVLGQILDGLDPESGIGVGSGIGSGSGIGVEGAAELPCERPSPHAAMLRWRRPEWFLHALPPAADAPLPDLAIALDPPVVWAPPGASGRLRVTATGPAGRSVEVSLEAGGARVVPDRVCLALDQSGRAEATLELSAEGPPRTALVTATLPGGRPATSLLAMPSPAPPFAVPARAHLFTHPVALDPPGPVGYLPGTGDPILAALAALGVATRALASPSPSELSGLATLIIGLRAYQARPALRGDAGAIAAFCRAGGHAVVLAQTAPFDPAVDAPLAGDLPERAEEACEEDGPAAFLAAADPLLTTPNQLGAADLAGWIEQRGSRFWRAWDPAYRPLVDLGDPGRPRQKGAWLTAQVGAGRYTYCALALHRQLLRAVPGAFRILANLVSWRQPAGQRRL